MLLFEKPDFLDDESDDDGSESGSAGICKFTFCFDEYVGNVDDSVVHVHGVGCGVFSPTAVE